MSNHTIIFPSDFDSYALEVAAKGWFSDVQINVSGKTYRVNIYDPIRLGQEIEDCLSGHTVFAEPNLLIVRSVSRESIEKAVSEIIHSGQIYLFAHE